MEAQSQWEALQMIEHNGGTWRGIWHSHPTSPAYPSPIDMAQSLNWPGIIAMVVSLATETPVIRAFLINNGQEVNEVPIQWAPNRLP